MNYRPITGVVDLSDLKKSNFDLSDNTLFFLHLTVQVLKNPCIFWMHLVPLGEYKLDKAPTWETWRANLKCLPDDIPENLLFNTFDAMNFWYFFHMEKCSLTYLINHFHGFSFDDGYVFNCSRVYRENVNICLSVWYLRNNERQLTDALGIFNITTIEEAESMLEEGLQSLSSFLKKNYIIWPNNEEKKSEIRTGFGQNFHFFDCIGVIGDRIFETERGEELLVHIVTDYQCRVTGIDVSYDKRPELALKTSELYKLIEEIDESVILIASPEYTCFEEEVQIRVGIPELDSSDEYENDDNLIKLIEYTQKNTAEMLKFVDATFMEVVARFPRVKNLHRNLPDAVTTAFGLHNYCMDRGDIYPNVLVESIKILKQK